MHTFTHADLPYLFGSFELPLELKRICRGLAGSHKSVSVEVVDNDQAPIVTGSSYCWRTKGGAVINCPMSYGKRGWSNMVYHNSTLRVEVGSGWLMDNAPTELLQKFMQGCGKQADEQLVASFVENARFGV